MFKFIKLKCNNAITVRIDVMFKFYAYPHECYGYYTDPLSLRAAINHALVL